MDGDNNCSGLNECGICSKLFNKENPYACDEIGFIIIDRHEKINFSRGALANKVCFLKKGSIKIMTLLSSGEERIKYILTEGEIIGVSFLLGEEPENDYAVAMEECTIAMVDANFVKKGMKNNPLLNEYIFGVASIRLNKMEKALESILYKDAQTRIKDFIKDYIEDLGDEKGGSMIAKNLLSNKDIAKITGTSRQTVNKTLNDLKRLKVIDFDTNTITWVGT
ncbi:Crp/Fnr family transcriptional regulator [Flagellimonas sp. 2504JD4-2]